jgi:hypothetical protein
LRRSHCVFRPRIRGRRRPSRESELRVGRTLRMEVFRQS